MIAARATTVPGDQAGARAAVRALLDGYTPRWEVRCDAWMRSFDGAFSRRLAREGLIGLTWPAEVGGAGLSNELRLVITEELLRSAAPVAGHWVADRQIGPAVLRHGSESLRARLLPGIIAGEITFCLGMSEPDSGSDLAAVKTKAVHDEANGYRLSGTKIWTSNAHRVTHIYVLARSDSSGSKHEGLTEFVVPMDAPGLTTRPILDLSGEHHFNETLFEDVLVPAENVIGEPGHGWAQVTEQLAFERGGAERYLSTYPILGAILSSGRQSGLLDDVEHVRRVGGLLAQLVATRAMAARVARRMDEGAAPVIEAAQLKYLGTALEKEILRLGTDVAPEAGVPSADGLSGLVADAVYASPGGTLRGGTSEILLTVLARADAPRAGHDDLDLADLITSSRDAVSGLVPSYPDTARGEDVWALARDLGWHRVGVGEDAGGSGGETADLLAITEAVSARGLPTTFAGSAVAAQLAARFGAPLEQGDVSALVVHGCLAATLQGESVSVEGVLVGVGSATGDTALVPVDLGGSHTLLSLPLTAPGVTVRRRTDLAGDASDLIECVGVELPVTALLPESALAEARSLVRVTRAARIVGLCSGALAEVRAHVEVRHQFGKPLIAFQAVSHQVADLEARVALARVALWDAVGARGEQVAADRATAALVCALDMVWKVASSAHQLLGAMGTTLEHPLHRFTLRLHAERTASERAPALREELGVRALEAGEESTWDWIVGVSRGGVAGETSRA